MNSIESAKITEKKSKSLEEEIIAQRNKLKKLEDRHKEQQRKEKEKNYKLVLELIKSEKLDLVSVDQWRQSVPEIKKLLGLAESEKGKK